MSDGRCRGQKVTSMVCDLSSVSVCYNYWVKARAAGRFIFGVWSITRQTQFLKEDIDRYDCEAK